MSNLGTEKDPLADLLDQIETKDITAPLAPLAEGQPIPLMDTREKWETLSSR